MPPRRDGEQEVRDENAQEYDVVDDLVEPLVGTVLEGFQTLSAHWNVQFTVNVWFKLVVRFLLILCSG